MSNINPNNYKILQNTWASPPYGTWESKNFPGGTNSHKVYFENFSSGFNVTYAVRGPISNSVVGGRSGIPRLGPIPGPLPEPSPLNVEWRKQYSQDLSKNLFGIL